MAHTTRDKTKLLNRVRRLHGQMRAIEKALDQELECSEVLQRISACRGAINGLMAEVLEGHVRFHVVNPTRRPSSKQSRAAQELIEILKKYLA